MPPHIKIILGFLLKWSRTLWGPGYKSFMCPHLLLVRNRLRSASLTFPEFQRADSKELLRASLVARWLRICLPMQGTRVRGLVWEDPTCRGATRPVSHNY